MASLKREHLELKLKAEEESAMPGAKRGGFENLEERGCCVLGVHGKEGHGRKEQHRGDPEGCGVSSQSEVPAHGGHSGR